MQRLAFKNTATIGLMLFALFFGAGNLVFPAMMGQQSGEHFALANFGFLLTGVGLPLLGIFALSYSRSDSLLALTNRVHPIFALGYTTMLYLTIGPLFAMPRTGSVSYEIALKPYVSAESHSLVLLLFSIVFFSISLVLAINPSRMVDIIGKVLTPIKIVFITLLAITAFISPPGKPQAAQGGYETAPFFNGFQEGYLTMDALAAFVFGIVVVQAIRAKGITETKSVLIVGLQAAVIAAAFLAIIYTSLTYIGATSVTQIGLLENGGEVLNRVTDYYFGTFGAFILGIIVLIACLTTSIGLTVACSSYFHSILPRVSYRTFCIVLSIVSAVLANAGLTQLIQFSVPVLAILYPLAIVLIVLTFTHKLFRGKAAVYRLTLLFTGLVSIVDGLKETVLEPAFLHRLFTDYLPLHSIGLGWLLPACFGFVLGLLSPRREFPA